VVSSCVGVAVGGGEGGAGWFRFLFGAIVNDIEGFVRRGMIIDPADPVAGGPARVPPEWRSRGC
jgi:hypothetical protein